MKIRCDQHDVSPIFPQGGFIQLTDVQLEQHCVIPFPASTRRTLLFQNLVSWLAQLRQSGLIGTLWIDGSFLTTRPEPEDVDLVLVIDQASLPLIQHNPQHFDYLLDHDTVLQRYNLEVFPIIKGENPAQESYWRGWFGFCRDDRTPKGIAEVQI